MKNFIKVLFCLALLVPMMYPVSAGAADDDTQASVYLVFDPETGEFVTVDDSGASAQHQAQQDGEAFVSVAESGDTADQSPMSRIIGAALVLTLLGGAVWLKRSRHDGFSS